MLGPISSVIFERSMSIQIFIRNISFDDFQKGMDSKVENIVGDKKYRTWETNSVDNTEEIVIYYLSASSQ